MGLGFVVLLSEACWVLFAASRPKKKISISLCKFLAE